MHQSDGRAMAREVARLVAEKGGRTFYVGGFVRDALLHQENKDVDIEVHGITPVCLAQILDSLGERMTVGELFDRIAADPLVSGVTFSGGEPFLHARALAKLAKMCREAGKTVMVYTGYLYEKLREAKNPDWDALLAEADILVDGPYLEKERSLDICFRGSRNQRVFFLSDRGKLDEKYF